jgi:hypothetical protein
MRLPRQNGEAMYWSYLAEIVAGGLAPDDLERVCEGLARVRKWLHGEATAFERCHVPLRGEQ